MLVRSPSWLGNGETLHAPLLSEFPREARYGCTRKLAKLAAEWPRALDAAPRSLHDFTHALRRRHCVLERTAIDGRVYWAARFPVDDAPVTGPLIGAVDGFPWTYHFEDGTTDGWGPSRRLAKKLPSVAACRALPELRWLAQTFGSLTLAAEHSGAAVFGHGIRAVYAGSGIVEQVIAEQPPGHEKRLSLYEIDGDWLMFDLPNGTARWMGGEWGNVGKTRLAPRAALKHVLETLLRGELTNASQMAKR